MVAFKTHRRATAASSSRLPDDRLVVATALAALSTLVLMLCAASLELTP
jgi:hypothetical protein